METEYLKQKFNFCKDIPWDIVIDKIAYEYENKTQKVVTDQGGKLPPTFVLHAHYLPGKLQKIYDRVNKKWRTHFTSIRNSVPTLWQKESLVMHVYTSLGANSVTFGRHCDEDPVLIIQSVGKMIYKIDGIDPIEFNPGDGILIPAGVYHTPYVLEPRITLSFS